VRDLPREEVICREVVDAAIKIHRCLGPGLYESVYETCLAHELTIRGFVVRHQVPFAVVYEGVRMEKGFRADMVIDDLVILEIKSVAAIAPVHRKQLLSYLVLTDKRIGLLLNFGSEMMRDGISRVVNHHRES
jgi:GxxExxY protein